MKRWICSVLGAALLLVPTEVFARVFQITAAGQSVNIQIGGESLVQLDSTSDDFWVFVGGKTVSWALEPDTEGVEELCTVDVYSAPIPDTDAYREFWWDSDFDGVPDTNTLDGVSLGQRLVESVRIPGWLYFDTTAAPSASATCILSISAVSQD